MLPHPKMIFLTKKYICVRNADIIFNSSHITYYLPHIILLPLSFKNIKAIQHVFFYKIPSSSENRFVAILNSIHAFRSNIVSIKMLRKSSAKEMLRKSAKEKADI